MKRGIVALTALAGVLVFALAGCAGGASGSAASSASASSASSVASSTSSASSAASSEASSSGGYVGMPNPWHQVSNASEAAEGAGIDGFEVPEGAQISLGAVAPELYQYMAGIAEADVPFPAVQMTIRKGEAVIDDDISGDYNQYAHTWTQNINGIDVTCSGNREGESIKTTWIVGAYDYSILIQSSGGDSDYGLKADDLNILVGGIK